MKFCSLGIPNLELKVNKLMSDVLLKDTQHAWVDL